MLRQALVKFGNKWSDIFRNKFGIKIKLTETDKIQHMALWFLIVFVPGMIGLPGLITGLVFGVKGAMIAFWVGMMVWSVIGLIFGAWKELWRDGYQKEGCCEWADWRADCIGIIAAWIVMGILVGISLGILHFSGV